MHFMGSMIVSEFLPGHGLVGFLQKKIKKSIKGSVKHA